MKKMFDSSEAIIHCIVSNTASVLCAQNQFTPSEVVQWSNHRVMEWLRSVDLAEYAPNLRGSGVHGGLVVSTHFHFHIYTHKHTHFQTMMRRRRRKR